MDFTGKDNYSLSLHKMPDLTLVKEFTFKSFSLEKWPILKFAKEDCVALMAQKTDLILMETSTFTISHKLPLSDIDYFSTAESATDLTIVAATFEKHHGFEVTSSKLTVLTHSDLTHPLYSQELDRAQDLKAYFSPNGSDLIVMTQTFHDETGKSYYGQSNLYFFKKHSQKFAKIHTSEGPIHDISWAPNSEFFVVISGFMPAKSVLFDKKLNAVFEFGTHYRNFAKWNPFSRFLVLAGFGNLNGEMEVWDIKSLTVIGKGKSECAIKMEWAVDGRHFYTGVLNPRLRVNNNYKIFKYNCKQLSCFDFSESELYDVQWVPNPILKYSDRDPSPPSKEENVVEDKPRKLFNPKGRSNFMSVLLKGDAGANKEGGKKFTSNAEYLRDIKGGGGEERKEKPKEHFPPGYVPPPEKKRKKKKKVDEVIGETL